MGGDASRGDYRFDGFARCHAWAQKKADGTYPAQGAALGARSLKSGQSRWFVGYKKHTLRLWLNGHAARVLFVPLVSWVAPASRADVDLLWPSVRYCAQELKWLPQIVVGDMAYINLQKQRRIREQWDVAVVTRLRPDMNLPPPFEPGPVAVCAQGQRLEWLGYEVADQLHWFGVNESQRLCPWCWQQASCPRQFSYAPAAHEILFGRIPLASRVSRQLLRQARSWIEASQAYEKNRLGLSQMFLNSLRLTWVLGLLADTVLLLRARAVLSRPPSRLLLEELIPKQLLLDGLQNE